MSDIIPTTSNVGVPLPVRAEIAIRPAVASDVTFIDGLQRIHSDNVGWMPTTVLEKKIEKGEVLIAEGGGRKAEGGEDESISPHSAFRIPPTPIGYCMGQDRYFKRDDVGIIYQMNIEPGHQRGLVGATLLKAQFERSAYGCKLYCCWCAQDIAANKFWEAMGFVPLAFRAGSRGKQRVHIFWQRRIRAGDETTPYWFPSQTGAGALKEDRLVLPIPPGTHWSEVRPTVLPSEEFAGEKKEKAERKPRVKKEVVQKSSIMSGGLRFGPPPVEMVEKVKEPKKKVKNDPKLIAAARELRDRWLEQVNAPGGDRLLVSTGKYDVSRMIACDEHSRVGEASVVEIPQAKRITAIAA